MNHCYRLSQRLVVLVCLLTFCAVPFLRPEEARAEEARPEAGRPEEARAEDAPVSMTRFWDISLPQGTSSRKAKDGGLLVETEIDGTYGLRIDFLTSERKCREAYGDAWASFCGRRTFMEGRDATDVRLEPPMRGQWEWTGDASLALWPEEAWVPGASYSLVIPQEALPPDTQLVRNVSFRTREITSTVSGNFKLDPFHMETMAVSGSFQFNYPMDRESVLSRIHLDIRQDAKSPGNPLLGEAVFTWQDNSDGKGYRTLMFSVPVLELPDEPSRLDIVLNDGAMAVSGGKPASGVSYSLSLPAKKALFAFEDATATVVTTPEMQARQVLGLSFSLPVKAADIQNSLDVLLLPRQKEEENENKLKSPYSWWTMAEVDAQVLKRATPVKVTVQDGGDIPSLTATFTFEEEIEGGRSLLITLREGLTGTDGLPLGREGEAFVRAPSFEDELAVMQNGTILALRGDKKLALYSRGLDTIQYTVSRIRPEFLNILTGYNYGSFENPQLYDISMDYLSENMTGSLPVALKDFRAAQFSALDMAPFLTRDGKGLFRVDLTGTRSGSYRAGASRFLLVTDLGLIHKIMADDSSVVYAASLEEGKPSKGTGITVIGANGLPVFEGRTDKDGKVLIPNLSSLNREKSPKAIVARNGDDLAFLPWNEYERQVSYSRFDIGGLTNTNGMYAYLFSQRDMYRPGESVHFGYIVKPQVWGEASLKDLPLRAVVYDSRRNEFDETLFNLPDSGMGELNYELPENAPTGSYRIDVQLNTGDSSMVLASMDFLVEEFQPDTMRLSLAMSANGGAGWLHPADLAAAGGPLEARANLMNLFGAPAAAHRMRAEVYVAPAPFRFRQYPDWTFHDAAPLLQGRWETLPEQQSDDKGDVSWSVPSALYTNTSCRLSISAEGFDANGGRSVRAEASVLVSPLDMLVGWRSGSNLDYLRKDGKAEVEFLAVAPDLAPLEVKGLTQELLAVSYVKTLVRDDSGQYRYDTLRREKTVSEKKFDLPVSGKTIKLDLATPGQWLLLLKNSEGQIMARVPYTVAGNTMAAFGEDREPRFTARLDKKDYNPGDEVEILLSTPYKGAGLITVERDQVEAQAWFKAKPGDQVARIRLPKNLDGQAYINITYFRALDDPDIFTMPMASVVVPFTVNMEGRDLGLALRVLPENRGGLFSRGEIRQTPAGMPIVRPGGTFQVEVSANKPGKAVIFAVDEGILQMTSYQTPNPLRVLLGNRALEVRTYQYLDLLMPEYGLIKSVLSAYGGGEGLDFAGQGLNPFRRPGEKSAVFWSGMVDVDKKGRVLDIPVPGHFNGQLRIMAVGCSPEAVGSTRTDVKVQAEVVIQPTLPLFVTPGDIFEASVTLTDMSGLPASQGENGTGRNVLLEVDGGGAMELLGGIPEFVELQPTRGQTLRLRFKVLDDLGGHSLTFKVSPEAGKPGDVVTRSVGLSVRPGMPLRSDLLMGRLTDKGEDGLFHQEISLARVLYPQYAEGTVSVSPLPLPLYQSLMAYLARYPYGCTEQLVSGAFPNLVLMRFPALTPSDVSPDTLRERITGTLHQLAQRQNSEGGFYLWPNGYGESLFLDAYVADFLITAKDMGVYVPTGLFNRTMDNLRSTVAPPPNSMDDARAKAYAAWVLTRNGELTSNVMATLTAWLNRHQPNWNGDITAVFMAGCWKLMMEDQEALRLLSAYEAVPEKDRRGGDYNFNPLTSRSFYLSVLAAQFPDLLNSAPAQAAVDVVFNLVSGGYYVSVSAAQASRALMLYSSATSAEALKMDVTARDKDGAAIPLPVVLGPDGLSAQADLGGGELDGHLLSRLDSLVVTSSSPVYWQVRTTGFDKLLPLQPRQEGMEVRREIRRPDGSPVDTVRLGDELVIAISARTYGKSMESIAITDLLPGAFEMVLAEGGQAVEAGTSQGQRDDDRSMWVQYVERRENRLLLFPDLTPAETVFRYRVKATSRGSFTLPPISAEAMYDSTVRAMSGADVIVVE